jgi:hypothetical protein
MRPQGFGQAGNGLEDLGWNDMGFEPPKAAEAPRDETHDAFGEDVVEHPRAHHPSGLTPVGSPVHDQQAEIEERLEADETDEEFDETAELYDPEAESEELNGSESETVELPAPVITVPSPVAAPASAPAPRRVPSPRSAPGSKAKAAFTLRLDPDRHLKLRLACAVNGRSAQQLVTDALDALLERIPELDAMASKAKRKG